ncbi:metallophosphoesterase family protein [Natrinema longum]|uniref:metallophosphoesterase family protein n=1 Tax=Natrinema longum TaxID=370324 RepID=UPI001CCCEC28|nr:metallophosphoesterase family protein [Natrinema longum]MBZ6497170.1 metallophosphoesterase [Natrinema longum]
MTESDFETICRVEGPTVDLLVISDLHLRATGAQYPVADLPVETHDIVLSLGDVVDENREHAKSVSAGDAYEERGRAFLERLDEQGVPVLAVPGNHDPVDCTQRLSEGLTNIHSLHDVTRNVVVGADWSLTVAGWGCEQFDFTPALLSPDYPDIPVEDEVRTPDAVASTLLRAAGEYLADDLSETNLAHKLGTEATNPSFETSLARLDARFETLVELVEGENSPTVVASHISPFNVPFDIRGQHSHDGDYHFGSVALRVALAAAGVDACLSGHTHQRGLTVIPTTSGHSYVHNPGDAGVSSISISQDGTLHAEQVDVVWR